MGKVEVFKIPVVGTLFRWLGGFPVLRDGTDRKAVRDSIAILHAGEPLVVYPEGTRQHGPAIQPLQPGAAYLAIRAGVPIVPVGIAGSEEIFRSHGTKIPRFGRAGIVVGDPIFPPERTSGVVSREVVNDVTNMLAKELQQVFDEANALR
jgi:1-acyl-sn-glycerol-3-phosphate acyltransferase